MKISKNLFALIEPIRNEFGEGIKCNGLISREEFSFEYGEIMLIKD